MNFKNSNSAIVCFVSG